MSAEMQSALKHVATFLHKPMQGEAYPEDKRLYCRVCMDKDGGSLRWPCPTVKIAEKALKQKKKSKCYLCANGDSVPIWSGDGFHYHGRTRCTAHKSMHKDPGISAGGSQNATRLRRGWTTMKTSWLTPGELIERINRVLNKRGARKWSLEEEQVQELITEWYHS